ncbi:MAG: DHH family phosphoesterase [Bacillota bacterium]|nr:DHH family phosphoesterase [Bacillota bacterium]
MERKDFKTLVQPYIKLDLIVMVVISLIVLYLKLWAGVACLVAVVFVSIYHAKIAAVQTEKQIAEIKSNLTQENDEITRNFIDTCPIYMCISNINGDVTWSNEGFRNEITSEDSIAEIIDSKILKKLFEQEQYEAIITYKESRYKLTASTQDESGHSKRMIYFENVTAAEIVRDKFKDSRPAFALINVDNYDELMAASPVEKQSVIVAEIETMLREWAATLNASLTRYRSNRYILFCEHKEIDAMLKDNFSIMEKIHEVETEADFPTTLSIGIGVDAATLAELDTYAYQALDLALGRGGDQVVIKRSSDDIEYFGGSLSNVERRNKGKSRIMAHALVQLIHDADKVLVMGHVRPDLDSFGSAIGVAALAQAAKKKAYIVLNEPNEAIELAYQAARETGRFEFINGEMANALAMRETLLVIVDTHIGPMCEEQSLLDRCKKLVVIDHHRKSANAIENTMLTYMEPFASSASEQVCEMIQYAGNNFEFEKFEMDALLAGITLDTKNFTQNTGARTFESASWLRRNGADMRNVMNFFKMRLDFFQKKVNMIASAEILNNGYAIAYTKESDESMQVLTAQAADELLEMRGVNAVFVAGALTNGKTTVSARSNGLINVQVMMEHFGGGGHINIAAAQFEQTPELAIQEVIKYLREEKLI